MSFLVNNPAAVDNIMRSANEPLDPAAIKVFWQVYTTTKRRFSEPADERLENYWWRLWGSRKRELKSTTVADLFNSIRNGGTFRPLRRPSSHNGVTPPPGRNARRPRGYSGSTIPQVPAQPRPSTSSSTTVPKPPMAKPHPILKKARGPSKTGERPTARFVSPKQTPPESEQEAIPDSSVDSNSHVVVQPPTPDQENTKVDKKTPAPAGTGGRKKPGVVASSAKKRPVLPRRQSSQSSAELSHPSQRSTASTPAQKRAQNKPPVSSKFQENFSPANPSPANTQKSQVASKDSGSKRNSAPKASVQRGESSRAQQSEAGPSKQKLVPAENNQDVARDLAEEELKEFELRKVLLNTARNRRQEEAGSSRPGLPPIERTQEGSKDPATAEELTTEELKELSIQQAILKQANDSMKKPPSASSQKSNSESQERVRFERPPRKTSSEGQGNGRPGGVKMLPLGTKSTTSVAASSFNATGNLDIGSSDGEKPGSALKDKGKGKSKASDEVPAAGSFPKRPIPPVTQDPESTGPLSRSKSMLTLEFEDQLPKPANGYSKQPVPATTNDAVSTGPLSRSKSQLTLMLEKDEAKKSRRSSENDRKKKK